MKPPKGRVKGWPGCPRSTDRVSSSAHSSCHQQHWCRRGWLQHGLWCFEQLQLQTWGCRRQNQRQLWQWIQGSLYQNLWQQLCNQKEGLQMKGRKLQNPSTSSPLLGFFSKSGNAAPVTTISVPSPPCWRQQGGNAPVQEVQSWALGDLLLGHLLLGHCRKCRDNTHTQDASLQPGAGLCVPMCLSWAFITKELSLSSGWVHVSFSASLSINAQCHLILSVSLLPRMSTSASSHLTFLLLILAFLWSLAWHGSLLSGSGQVDLERELLLVKGWDLLLIHLWTGSGLLVHWGPYFTHWPCETRIITPLQRGSHHPPSSSQKRSVSHTNCLSLLEWLILLFIHLFILLPTRPPILLHTTGLAFLFFQPDLFHLKVWGLYAYVFMDASVFFLYSSGSLETP